MKKKFFGAALLLLMPFAVRVSFAQTIGVSYFALQAFNDRQCEVALGVFDGVKKPALSIIWGTFGSNNACLEKFLSTVADRPHIVQIHITNQTCVKFQDCELGEIGYRSNSRKYNRSLEQRDRDLIVALRRRVFEIAKFMAKSRNANTELLLSTGLEDRYSSAGLQVMLGILNDAKAITPFSIVRNPEIIRESTGADYIELHGFRRHVPDEWLGRCILNNDGNDILFRMRRGLEFSKVQTVIAEPLSQGCLFFLWWDGPQGLEKIKDGARACIGPKKRRFIVRSNEVKMVNTLMTAAGG